MWYSFFLKRLKDQVPFQSQDWQIQQLFDNGAQKIYYETKRDMLASQQFCELAPQEGSDYMCFQILPRIKFFMHFTNRKMYLKINEF